MTNTPKVLEWRYALSERPSVIDAVSPDYNRLLNAFLIARNSHLTTIMPMPEAITLG